MDSEMVEWRFAYISLRMVKRGSSERHCYFNDREKWLKGKDLRIFVAIMEKHYFFLIFAF